MTRYFNLIRDTPGLVGYWRLGEASGTLASDVQNGNPGTYTASPTLGVAGAIIGDDGTAVTFAAGSSQYVALTSTGKNFGNGPYSMEAWFKTTASGANFAIFDLEAVGGAVGEIGFGLGNLANGKVSVVDGATRIIDSGAVLYNDNLWHHVVITKIVAGNVWKMYVDGVDVTTAGTAPTQSTSNIGVGANGRIAANYNSGTQRWFFTGTIDEVAIYNVALTQAQAQQHYGGGKSGFEGFQPDSFQNDTFQNLIEFFQADAFQNDSFQVDISAFDTAVSFQNDAFQPAAISTSAPAGGATGTGAAADASVIIAPNAGNAAGTGAASGPSVSLAPNAGLGSGTGASGGPSSSVAPTAGSATGTGQALTPSESEAPGAQNASGTGTASGPSLSVALGSGSASGTGTANTPAASIAGTSGLATGTGSGGAPAASIAVSPSSGTGTGQAFDATVTVSGDANAPADIASGSGQAFDAQVQIPGTGGHAGLSRYTRRAVPQTLAEIVAETVLVASAQAGGDAFNPRIETFDHAQDEQDLEVLLGL